MGGAIAEMKEGNVDQPQTAAWPCPQWPTRISLCVFAFWNYMCPNNCLRLAISWSLTLKVLQIWPAHWFTSIRDDPCFSIMETACSLWPGYGMGHNRGFPAVTGEPSPAKSEPSLAQCEPPCWSTWPYSGWQTALPLFIRESGVVKHNVLKSNGNKTSNVRQLHFHLLIS